MAKDNRPIDLVLTGSKSLRGTVVWEGPDDSAIAISSATVAVKGAGQFAKTDAKGHFSLDELPPEPLTLVVKAPGFLPKEVPCDPRSNAEQDDPLARRSRPFPAESSIRRTIRRAPSRRRRSGWTIRRL